MMKAGSCEFRTRYSNCLRRSDASSRSDRVVSILLRIFKNKLIAKMEARVVSDKYRNLSCSSEYWICMSDINCRIEIATVVLVMNTREIILKNVLKSTLTAAVPKIIGIQMTIGGRLA